MRCRLSPRVREMPWSSKWKRPPGSLSAKFRGQKSLADYSPWHDKESDMTEHAHTHTHTHTGAHMAKVCHKDHKNFNTLKKVQCRQQINKWNDVLILEELYNHWINDMKLFSLWTNLFQFSFFQQILVNILNSKHHLFFYWRKNFNPKRTDLKKLFKSQTFLLNMEGNKLR